MIVPCLWESGPWCLGWLVEKLAFPLVIAGGISWLAIRQLQKKRQIDFADKQLTEFYAPMVGARAEIFNDKVFDSYLQRAQRFVETKYAERGKPEWSGQDATRRLVAELIESVQDERVDAYLAMRKLFAQKMAYADKDTRAWYDYFYAFVEVSRRVRRDKKNTRGLAGNETYLALASMIEERPLEPFYRHLLERTEQLQREIRGEAPLKINAEPPPEVGEPYLFLPMS